AGRAGIGRDGRRPAAEVVGQRRSLPEMTSPSLQENTNMLIAYEVALDLVRALRPVVAQLRSYSPEAADQVERAASSIVLNLAEGGRRHGRDPGASGISHTAAPARSAARLTWRTPGAGRST